MDSSNVQLEAKNRAMSMTPSLLDLLEEDTFAAQQNGPGEGKLQRTGKKPPAANDSQKRHVAPHCTAIQSDAARLVELAKSARYFHDPLDRAFVQLEVNGHTETWPVESGKFKNLLGKIFYQCEGRIRVSASRGAG